MFCRPEHSGPDSHRDVIPQNNKVKSIESDIKLMKAENYKFRSAGGIDD
jgi:hypothetical protein